MVPHARSKPIVAALLAAFLVEPALARATQEAAGADGRAAPNILFLIADDLTAEALSCYGARTCRTPNIDALAARGVQFDRAYCQFPVCGPSRAALLSGLYPESIRVTGNGSARKIGEKLAGRPTLPQFFRDRGYRTARISKIFHMRVPGDITAGVHGPDHAPSWTERHNCQAPEWYSEGPAELLTSGRLRFDRDAHYNLGFGTAFYTVRTATGGPEQADTIAADKAVSILTSHRETHPNQPLFLAVGFVRPHVPLVAPADFFDAYPPDDLTLADSPPSDQGDIPKPGITMSSTSNGLSGHPDRQRRVLQAYYAAVSFMDAQVGRVLRALDQAGMRDTTYVVFMSDHGYHLGEHDLWQKLSLHEESMRIPWILAGPDIEPARTRALVEQIDLYPTLVDLAGFPAPDPLHGQSAVPVLRDPNSSVREDVYGINHRGRMLRTSRFAWMEYEGGGAELYDMDTDPRQIRNLADDPEYAEVRSELQDRLEERALAAGVHR